MSYNHKILIRWLGLEAATIGVLRNFAVFTVKHLCQNLFFKKVADLRPLLKKRLWYRSFSVSFAKFLRTHFFTEHLLATAPIGDHMNIQGSSFLNWIVKILEQCVSLAWSLIMKVPNFWLLMLNRSQSHTVYRRVWNYVMLIPNKNVVRQSYQSLMFIKWHAVTLKAYSYPYSSK